MRTFPLGRGADFHREALVALQEAEIPFLIGGAEALRHYTGIERETKVFEVLVRERDLEKALVELQGRGFTAGGIFPHWLAKAHRGEAFIDLVYRAGNGLCEVADDWFLGAPKTELLGVKVALCPPERMIWQKAYIMERERYEGADVAHLLRSCAEEIDWPRLVALFGPDWRVLLTHLVLFGFVYPGERDAIPPQILGVLVQRLERERTNPAPDERVCRGTLLSREQYLRDVECWDYRDARLDERSSMTPDHIRDWTNAIAKDT